MFHLFVMGQSYGTTHRQLKHIFRNYWYISRVITRYPIEPISSSAQTGRLTTHMIWKSSPPAL
ncbi:hypothetical protein [Spirosoma sp.]|uniref:hypothetical protein n=1 Tax=Spirosoma sp. TaxID=1899569 RepID=UPI0009642B43|nr:hypothetical protein [Spirosoma sp.]MBN8826843.1 hypothetical protein [Spirosoma sp.]OJW80340.1 MAG: hypothetical protein BGO59_33110 [Spirosoma sp. 48-14]